MRSRTLAWLVPLLLALILMFNVEPSRSQGNAIIQGYVYLKGQDALSGATVIIWDLDDYSSYELTTDKNGFYSINVTIGHTYRIFAYYDSPSTPGIDTIPVRSIDLKVSKHMNRMDFTLYPGASMILEGKILYITSTGTKYTVYVVDPSSGNDPVLGNTNENFTNVFTWASGTYSSLKLPLNIVIVPAGVPVDLKVSFTALIKDPLNPLVHPYATRKMFSIDNQALHYNLNTGDLVTIDLSWYSLQSSINYVNDLFDLTWSRMEKMEDAGFYLGRLKEDMGKVRRNIELAQVSLSEKKYDEGLDLLSAAYSTLMINVAINMNMMWLTAQTSAIFMPVYPAFFAVTAAFFLFEDTKRKMLSSILLYAASFALLYYVYPGLQIVDPKLVTGLAIMCMFLAIFVAFIVPRFIKEPDIPGRYPVQSVLTMVFSIAKRNVKRRLSRGLLGITSLAILVMAFTAFTSFGRVIGLLITPLNMQPAYEGVMVKNIPPPWSETGEPYWPLVKDEIEWLKGQRGVLVVSPLIMNKPGKTLVGSLRISNLELQILGAIGIDPFAERNFTDISTSLISGSLNNLKRSTVVLSQSAANTLGVGLNDKVTFYVHTATGLQVFGNLTVVGIMDNSKFSSLKDLNGESLVPYRFQMGEYVRAPAEQIVILNWQDALKIEDMAVYRIAIKTDGSVNLDAFAREIVQAKEYNVWVSEEDNVLQYHFGEYLEIGGISLLVPLLIVLFNLGLIMISIVNERTREIFTLTCVGFNPTHITALFLAESVVMGLVGGGIGYLMGMSAYRLMNIFSIDIAVRQKLEWYWSVIGVMIALATAILSAIRPASRAAMKATPSLVKKIKFESHKERLKREEEIWKVYQSQKITMPVRINAREITFFASYLAGRLHSLEKGLFERIENYEESESETPEGHRIRNFKYTYVVIEGGKRLGTINELTAFKRAKSDYYVLSLDVNPEKPGIPGSFIDRTVRFLRDILGDWEEEKPRIVGAI